MSLATLASISGLPGIDLAVTMAVDLAQTVQNIKIYRQQCVNLSDRCIRLLIAFREKYKGLEGTELMAEVDEIASIIEKALRKAHSWASMNRIRSFVCQSDIKNGLEQLYRDIEICAQQFSIASSAELHKSHRELALIRERDVAENRDILQHILRNVNDLHEVLSLNAPAVQNIMQTIQEELQQQVDPDHLEQREALQNGLLALHRQTQYLPPMIDLTGQVEKTSEHPVAYGAYNDVYTGLWLGEEKVALKFPRAVNHSSRFRKRFQKEVEIWRDLQHPHISRLYGIIYIGPHIYTVSAWMDHGDALSYIQSTEEVIDRLQLIKDVARGLEYLHLRSVVHGDLRAANVLISDSGRACLSDFGLSKVIEEVAPEAASSSSQHGDSPVRWQARELVVDPDDIGHLVSVSTATDVWSFGMTCLEILTGSRPYENRGRDASVIADLIAKKLPDRPSSEEVIYRGLTDLMWSFLLSVWNWEASDRPSMTEVRAMLRSISLPPSNPMILRGGVLHESPKIAAQDLSPGLHKTPSPLSRPYALPTTPSSDISTFTPSSSFPSTRHNPLTSNFSRADDPGPSNRNFTFDSQSSRSFTLDYARNRSTSSTNVIARQDTATIASNRTRPRQGTEVTLPRRPSYDSGSPTLLVHRTSQENSLAISIPGTSSDRPRTGTLSRVDERSLDSEHTRSASSTMSDPIIFNMEDITQTISARNELYGTSSSNLVDTAPSQSQRGGLELSSRTMFAAPHDHSSSELWRTESRPQGQRTISNGVPSGSSVFVNNDLFSLRGGVLDAGDGFSSGSLSSSLPSTLESHFRNGSLSSSSDIQHTRTSLMNFDGLDNTSVCHIDKNGNVVAATLAGLVDKLLKKSSANATNFNKDAEFREVVLTNVRLFSNCRDALKFLLRRYVLAEYDTVAEKVNTRYSVLDILKHWLKSHYAKAIDIATLQELRTFTSEINSPDTIRSAAERLSSVIDGLVNDATSSLVGISAAPRQASQGDSKLHLSNITPTDVAIAVTILEMRRYYDITPTDCVSYLLHQDEGNKIADARVLNNKLVNWVKKQILRNEKMEDRGDTLRFFVNVASECRKLKNFSSMSALIAAIDSPCITRLKLTRSCLDKSMKDLQRKLVSITDFHHNHRAYKDVLPSTEKDVACLPWLAIHLKDLQSASERHTKQVIVDSRILINFERYNNLYESMNSVLRFQKKQYELLCRPAVWDYVESHVLRTQVGRRADDAIEERSLNLQRKEDKDYDYRISELSAAGFRTARKK